MFIFTITRVFNRSCRQAKPITNSKKDPFSNAVYKGDKEPMEGISLEQDAKEIDEALAEVQKGEIYTHEEVVKMAKGWQWQNGKSPGLKKNDTLEQLLQPKMKIVLLLRKKINASNYSSR